MYFVYIIKSLKDSSLYIGYTEDLETRLKDHNSGKNVSTKYKTPLELIHYEAFLNKLDALNREKYLKSGWGWRSIKTMLFEYFTTEGRLGEPVNKKSAQVSFPKCAEGVSEDVTAGSQARRAGQLTSRGGG